MTAPETAEVLRTLLLAYPNLASDADRCSEISRRLEPFPLSVAAQAVDEYVEHGGDVLLVLSRLLAIAHRINQQSLEREADIKRKLDRQNEQRYAHVLKSDLERADSILFDMSDEDVMKERESILMMYQGKTREWASRWTAAQWRTNQQLRLKIAALCTRAG